MYDEDPSAYFPALKLLSEGIPAGENASAQKTLESAISILSSNGILDQPGALSSFNYALALHTAVPKIEAFYSYYDSSVDEKKLGVGECEAWVEWRGKGYCGVEELERDTRSSVSSASQLSYAISCYSHAQNLRQGSSVKAVTV